MLPSLVKALQDMDLHCTNELLAINSNLWFILTQVIFGTGGLT